MGLLLCLRGIYHMIAEKVDEPPFEYLHVPAIYVGESEGN